MQGLSSRLRAFNLRLLRLLGEISLSLLCLHSSWGSALDLDLPLHVGHTQTSVPRPDRTGLKQQLIRALLLTQAWGREGYGMWGEPAAAEASMTLQQPEARAVCSPGEVVLDHGTLAVAGCTGSQGGVDSDLCLHTGFLVTVAVAAVVYACLWGPR